MDRGLTICLICGFAFLAHGEERPVPTATRISDINGWFQESRKDRESRPFSITGTVTSADHGNFIVDDGTGRTEFSRAYASSNNTCRPVAGDQVRIEGTATLMPPGGIQIGKFRKESVLSRFIVEKTGHTEPPPPESIDLDKASSHEIHLHRIRTVGTVVEVTADEIDVHTAFVTLKCGTVFLPVIIDRSQIPRFKKLKDATIEIEGLYLQYLTSSLRKFVGPLLTSVSIRAVLQDPPADPFALPPIDDISFQPPAEIAKLGRRSASGLVLAVWDGNTVLLKTENECAVCATLAQGETPPPIGRTITVAGYPEVNLFHANLKLAVWRECAARGITPDNPATLSSTDILGASKGKPIDVTNHGRAITLCGIVQGLPANDQPWGEMLLQDGPHLMKINPGAANDPFAGLSVGCKVAVTGICILDGAPWQPHEVIPHLNDFKLILRNADDIAVLARPPWMTTTRLWKLVGILLAAVAVLFSWGTFLSRLIRRRTHSLVREQVERARSEFRIGERTRLAIELHDALSQGLTGVAGQIEATGSALAAKPEAAHVHLETAARMLQSCRTELRRCLWDLRGDALENPNFESAVRKTIAPVAAGATLHIRFSARRSKMSDTLAHAILCIARELAANAVQHGNATEIRIAGAHEPGLISFSVTDNGCGFDPLAAPGPEQGHFGLSGIRERIQSIGGAIVFSRTKSGGTRAIVTLGHASDPDSEQT